MAALNGRRSFPISASTEQFPAAEQPPSAVSAPSLKRNIAANFAGVIWMTLMSVAFIPLYIDYMGVEAWGLVGFFVILMAIFNLLDMGLSTTVNREICRLSCFPDSAARLRDVVRTLEIVYWSVAAAIGVIMCVLIPFLWRYWITTEELPPATVLQALVLMGLLLVFRWPQTFYTGGLQGLQKQVLLSATTAGFATLQGAGAVLVLWLVSPTIQMFFAWQLVVVVATTITLALLVWQRLPKASSPASFRKEHLLNIGRFTAGITAISILGVVLLQLDKLILSKMLTMKMLGYYMLANVVGVSLLRIANPIYIAVFPRFTQLATSNNQRDLKEQYHKVSQLLAVLILPASVVLAFFSYDFILAWTGNAEIAANTHLFVTLLAIANGCYGLATIPWALQLAHGWIRLGLYINVVAVLTVVPLTIALVLHFGAMGAAVTWCVCSVLFYLILQPIFMHRRLLQGEVLSWYLMDIGRPLLATLCVSVIGRLLISSSVSRGMLIGELASVSCIALSASVLATPATREWLLGRLRNHRCPATESAG